jgi:hypothetical protein
MILMNHAMMGAAGHQTGSAEWWLPSGVDVSDVEQALQAKGAASYADSLIDLSGHTDATSISAPVWSAEAGWQFNGSSHSIDSNLIVPTNNSWSVFVRFANTFNRSTDNYVIGQLKNTSNNDIRIMIIVRPSNPSLAIINYSYNATFTASPVFSGVAGFSGSNGYLDGTIIPSSAVSSTGSADISMVIGGTKLSDGGLTTHYGGDVLAFVAYNTILSSAQVAELTANMAAL